MYNSLQDDVSVSEREADNRHFAAEVLEVVRSDGPPREVQLAFFVWNIIGIDVVNEKFEVRFNLYASWEEDVSNINYKNVKGGFTQNSNIFKWQPQLRFKNVLEQNKDEYESWWRVQSITGDKIERPSDLSRYERVQVTYSQRIQGWFLEKFEMHHFPFDIQHLHIGVTSSWDHKNVVLSFDTKRPTEVSNTALNSQVWELHQPRLMSYKDEWDSDSMPLLSQASESATGARYCRAYLALTVSRKPEHILWNVMVIMALVGFMSFSTYALNPSDLGDRQACVLTLLLTTVAFKYVTIQMMPEVPYVTLMDAVIYLCLLLQALIMLGICIAARMDDPDTFDFVTAVILAIFWLAILVWFAIWSFLLSRRRIKYIEACNRRFEARDEKIKTTKELFYSKTVMPSVDDSIPTGESLP
uniref:Neurotransmitter-gated ion-channel ligand-binding domain-containing protein n=1 Tax=Fibrocapsa japonica TaxID=94617 RepID=A0A7S2V206_9STRA|mmetsp:Transcript_2237/g.3312  ORF Transcript_2237/g.3312 Transcript_2237/m.3312 type:complete len:414 (+) Transcript_2237:59-1300(+)